MEAEIRSYLFPPSTLLATSKQAPRQRKAALLRPHIAAIWGPFNAGGQRQRENDQNTAAQLSLNIHVSHQQQSVWRCSCVEDLVPIKMFYGRFLVEEGGGVNISHRLADSTWIKANDPALFIGPSRWMIWHHLELGVTLTEAYSAACSV